MTGDIECASLAEAINILEEVKRRAENIPTEKSLKAAGEIVEARTIKNFLDSEDPAGEPWPAVKRKMPPPILVKTGLLQRSAAIAARQPKVSGGELLIDATEPYYGAFHLVGDVRLPKREWLGFTDTDVEQMTEIASDNAVAFILTGEQ